MALDVDGVGVVSLEGDDRHGIAVVEGRGRVDEESDVGVGCGSDATRDGGLGEPWPDGGRGVAHGRAVVQFQG